MCVHELVCQLIDLQRNTTDSGCGEAVKGVGSDDEPGEQVSEQDGECASTSGAAISIRAKDPATANDACVTGLRIAPEKSMSDERSGVSAMRASDDFDRQAMFVERGVITNESRQSGDVHGRTRRRHTRVPVQRPRRRSRSPPLCRIIAAKIAESTISIAWRTARFVRPESGL